MKESWINVSYTYTNVSSTVSKIISERLVLVFSEICFVMVSQIVYKIVSGYYVR